MPGVSPYRIDLTRPEREELEARARRYTSPYRDVVRAKLVLLAFPCEALVLGVGFPGGLAVGLRWRANGRSDPSTPEQAGRPTS
jgi:hypothetical protein